MTSYLLESLPVFGAENLALRDARTAQSSPPAGCSPPAAGWGPEPPSPPTAALEETLQVLKKNPLIKPAGS